MARSHYENFLVATVLLPRRLRQPFYDIYAFCRTADDLADRSPSPQEALESLDRFAGYLEDTFAGNPPNDLFLALGDTIEKFRLPREPFDELLDAFRQDQHQSR
ncbi:MAG: squalene/phytoene synthase family protein, partial [Pirellulales bacterium]|nr:squalene/phytoene synthase family protein [Pirellulales bacterium]